MSILKRNEYSDVVLSIRDFIEASLDGSSYDKGSVETAQSQANNVTEALGRLCELLVEKKVLTEEDVFYIGQACKYKE